MPHDASDDVSHRARRRLSALVPDPAADSEGVPARRLELDAGLVGRLLAVAACHQRGEGGVPDVAVEDVGAGLSLFEDMRQALDQLETQVVMEARRRGMDWRQIAQHQHLNSSQAASQRYQRLMTRLEELRQGVR